MSGTRWLRVNAASPVEAKRYVNKTLKQTGQLDYRAGFARKMTTGEYLVTVVRKVKL